MRYLELERAERDMKEAGVLKGNLEQGKQKLREGRELMREEKFEEAAATFAEGLLPVMTSDPLRDTAETHELNCFTSCRWDLEHWLALAHIRANLEKGQFASAASYLQSAQRYQPAADYPPPSEVITVPDDWKEGAQLLLPPDKQRLTITVPGSHSLRSLASAGW